MSLNKDSRRKHIIQMLTLVDATIVSGEVMHRRYADSPSSTRWSSGNPANSNGITIHAHCPLIARLLIALWTSRKPTKQAEKMLR